MSNSALRCVLVYRLEKGGNAVCLAKYDHTYEASGGASSGRDDAFATAVESIVSNDPPVGISESNKIGGFKVVQSDEHQVTYGCDKDGVCCAVITGNKYQSRVAIGCLNELYTDFMAKFARDTKSAAKNSLSKKAKTIMKTVSEKYEDPSKVDKTSKILGQVDAVKGQMQSNIAGMLKNTEKAEVLNEKSNQLNEQASVFKKRSTDLKKQMRWKNLKMTLLLAAVVIAIACAIIIPLVNKAKAITGNGGGGGNP
mmetsp:Transcript_24124/g.59027  ORF Transcript_24124/g.59027 Transcript_24124/m.59027 type:complete len:254 (+) Transcript_24124:108-869(+)|eukprot:CAMPEP_0113642638 /NCGR_PEP_ID=MMETSP0017_2-20120614/22402_1 /TAXON_ID=2856 /ORGANISM="Cylindrotheca closterium" /LENGTH=253 /DNA_ID=CAMNT_0000554077 /DNA_START=87 /DNA_END=848 /DNA_ORIENTATION=+ /assembly_acc=CAM_ASM_000147